MGLFGQEYGAEDEAGVSPTEREFDHATALGKHRLIFLKDAASGGRHPKMQALVRKAEVGPVRKRFSTPEDLVTGLYAALIEYLEDKELLRFGPFDAAPCVGGHAGRSRCRTNGAVRPQGPQDQTAPLDEDIPPADLLGHLNLLNRGRLTNAAVLLFGKAPQRFLISSEIKCAHFHGTRVAKPIPSYQIYQGTVFDLVDQAVDFVLSKIALSVGTRAESIQAPVAYEIPKEVVTEAIVNAVVHRDYTSAGSVQVMLFADRLDVMSAGGLPPPLTVEKLRVPHESVPGNPLLARAMYLVKYIEQMGTGTLDMIERCVEAGLREPEFETSGEFVTRIRRAALAGQPVVFTDRTGRGVGIGEEVREGTDVPGEKIAEVREKTREKITIPREEIGGVGEKAREKNEGTRQKTREKILALVSTDPTITTARMADEIGIGRKGIEWQIRRLKRVGRLERIGPDKGGRWRVTGEDDG